MSARRMRIVLFSESCCKLMREGCKRGIIGPHPAKLDVVVPGIQEKFKHILISFSHGPCQRRVPLRTRIGVPHIYALDEAPDEKEVVFCVKISVVEKKRGSRLPLTAFLRRALVSFSAMTQLRWE